MKQIIIVVLCFNIFTIKLEAQVQADSSSTNIELMTLQTVEVSCGQCNFGLAGKSCDLAVRINDKAYFVDGTKIDDHGDAHAADGFCSTVRKAQVKGEIVDNRFKSSYFKLLPLDKKDH